MHNDRVVVCYQQEQFTALFEVAWRWRWSCGEQLLVHVIVRSGRADTSY